MARDFASGALPLRISFSGRAGRTFQDRPLLPLALSACLLVWAFPAIAHSTSPQTAAGRSETRQSRAAFLKKLVAAAKERTRHKVIYDPAYVVIEYPGGDVPKNRGVCTDVLVRAYRKVGIDLQKDVHEDMKANFSKYPKIWRLKKPDKNIDHRRVQNLMTLFKRHGETLAVTKDPADYAPGDIVCWNLPNHMKHIGIVIDRRSKDEKHRLVVHNIGAGPRAEDVLFAYKIIGHYRYFGTGRLQDSKQRPSATSPQQ